MRLHVLATRGQQNGSTQWEAVCCRKLDPSRPSVLACVRLRRTWWCAELQAETRCHAWLGYGYTESETVRKIAALMLIFMSIGWHLPNCTETSSPTWSVSCRKTIVLDRDADKIISRSIKQFQIQAWCYIWTSDPVSTEMSTAHQFSCLLVWKPAAQHEVVRWQEARHVDVHRTSAELVCSRGYLIIIFFYASVFVFFNKKERN